MRLGFFFRSVGFMMLCFFYPVDCRAQYQGFIYGKVTLKNKQAYTGPIKWSAHQRLWSDVLVVSKTTHNAWRYLSGPQRKRLLNTGNEKELDWKFMSLWKDKNPKRQAEILCRFGDISMIHVKGDREAQIYFKNGEKLRVAEEEKDNRHLGRSIVVYYKGDSRTIHWDEIGSIEFSEMPKDMRAANGEPLYGTVYTSKGAITGFIQWDKYKYLDSHQLTGKIDGVGKLKRYAFQRILQIEKDDNAAKITLKDGKKYRLKGTRDVGTSIRGIVVMHPILGRVVVEWKAFESVKFTEQPKEGLSYRDYIKPKRLQAEVLTKDNKKVKGVCIFDLDEEWDMELLEGRRDGLHYQIPFREIRKLVPKQERYTKVLLNNGKTYLLGWENDVSDRNWGVIIRSKNGVYNYFTWDKIKEISF
ncbi:MULTISPECIES: hypothetical protein [Olivibacter]|uniref:WG repeat protein n=1 Tax=Olivibacter jilunii TaxID=985016 RepID=A0ABW6B9F2_9SPHI|nr:hypothetical protein [Pseudosphingobacterium sp.]